MRLNGVVDLSDVALLRLWCKDGNKDSCIGDGNFEIILNFGPVYSRMFVFVLFCSRAMLYLAPRRIGCWLVRVPDAVTVCSTHLLA